VSRSKRLVRSLLMPTSLLGLARTNDCAQYLHLSAANRAIFIASMHLCHRPTFKNRKPWHTPGNVKLLLPPRQSRGFSLLVIVSNVCIFITSIYVSRTTHDVGIAPD
jgi:hypothetical protein